MDCGYDKSPSIMTSLGNKAARSLQEDEQTWCNLIHMSFCLPPGNDSQGRHRQRPPDSCLQVSAGRGVNMIGSHKAPGRVCLSLSWENKGSNKLDKIIRKNSKLKHIAPNGKKRIH